MIDKITESLPRLIDVACFFNKGIWVSWLTFLCVSEDWILIVKITVFLKILT